MIYQLAYFSLAKEKMLKPKLYKILMEARIANAKRDVTGVLVYVDGTFLQVLEGDKNVVQQLMQKISSDKRHGDVKIVFEGEIRERVFPSWRMAYVSANARELSTWAGLRNTTTIEDTLGHLQRTPQSLSDMLARMLPVVRNQVLDTR